MQNYKSYYFNAYKFLCKLLSVLIFGFLLSCSQKNDSRQLTPVENNSSSNSPVININTASVSDLEKLPHIGRQTAQEIIEHRERFGRFRKPEHLLLIRGVSDKKFREIKKMIVAE